MCGLVVRAFPSKLPDLNLSRLCGGGHESVFPQLPDGNLLITGIPGTIMNIHQEDVTEAGEPNNNTSAGKCSTTSSSGKETTGCDNSCDDQSVSNTDTEQNTCELETACTTGRFISLTDKGHSEQAQSESRDFLQYYLGDLGHVAVGKFGLDTTSEGIESSSEVITCPESNQGLPEGGQQAGLKENNPGKTAGVLPKQQVSDNPSTKGVSEAGKTMRDCSCDEGSLCYCPSSVFREIPRNSLHSKHSSRSERDMDAVLVADAREIGSKKMEEPNKVVLLEEGEDVRQCKCFMEDLVHRIFNNSASICQEDNAKFGEYCQLAIGRQWFARLVDSQRVNCKKVTEQTFYRLVQFFAVCLFECSDADDFTPGKSLMNMCFTFYHEHEGFPRCDDTTRKSFLYSHLNDQPIWKSLRFWNAAFFDAVHQERKQRQPDHQVNWRHLTTEERENTETLHENITFGQLATFLHNMMELELSRERCQEFLDKMATIGNLSTDQKELIQSTLSNHFHTVTEENTKNKKHHRTFNKMSFMRRKTSQSSREAVA